MRVLRARYGSLDTSPLVQDGRLRGKKASWWWKNLIQSGCSNYSLDWFTEGVFRKIGSGDNTTFWGEVWMLILGCICFPIKNFRMWEVVGSGRVITGNGCSIGKGDCLNGKKIN